MFIQDNKTSRQFPAHLICLRHVLLCTKLFFSEIFINTHKCAEVYKNVPKTADIFLYQKLCINALLIQKNVQTIFSDVGERSHSRRHGIFRCTVWNCRMPSETLIFKTAENFPKRLVHAHIGKLPSVMKAIIDKKGSRTKY